LTAAFDSVLFNIEVVQNDISDVILTLQRVLGLVQQNCRIDHQVYDLRGNMVSGRIRLFPSALDAQNSVNPFGEYQITASYDPQGRLINYLVAQVI
jgi:hypothetical protein